MRKGNIEFNPMLGSTIEEKFDGGKKSKIEEE